MANAAQYTKDEPFEELHSRLKRGDIIGVEGVPGRSKTGELSVRPERITSLSYCMHMLPKAEAGMKAGDLIMN